MALKKDQWVVFKADEVEPWLAGQIGRVLRLTPSGRAVVGVEDEEYVVDEHEVRPLRERGD